MTSRHGSRLALQRAGAAAAGALVLLVALTGCDEASIPTPGGDDRRFEVPQPGFSLEIPEEWSPEQVSVDDNLVARGPEDRESIAALGYPRADQAEREANEMAAALAEAAGITCLRKSDTSLGSEYPVTDCQRAVGGRTLRTIFVPVREQVEQPPTPPSAPPSTSLDSGGVGDSTGGGDTGGADTSGASSPADDSTATPPVGRSVLVIFRLYGLQLAKVESTVESVIDSVEFVDE